MTNVDIAGVGNCTDGVNEAQIDLTIQEYTTIAIKIIKSIAPRLRTGLAEEMLASEDAIANVATKIMLADGKWNGKGSKHGFRKQRAEFAIKEYMTRDIRNKRRNIYSMNFETVNPDTGQSCEFGDMVPCEPCEPVDMMIKSEEAQIIDDLLGSGVLTEGQEFCIRGYYLDGRTYEDIADERDISKERVRQLVNDGIRNLQRLANGDSK